MGRFKAQQHLRAASPWLLVVLLCAGAAAVANSRCAADAVEKASHKQVTFRFRNKAASHVNDQVLGSWITAPSPPHYDTSCAHLRLGALLKNYNSEKY